MGELFCLEEIVTMPFEGDRRIKTLSLPLRMVMTEIDRWASRLISLVQMREAGNCSFIFGER